MSLCRGVQKINPGYFKNVGDNFGYSLNLLIDPNHYKIILSSNNGDNEYQVKTRIKKTSCLFI